MQVPTQEEEALSVAVTMVVSALGTSYLQESWGPQARVENRGLQSSNSTEMAVDWGMIPEANKGKSTITGKINLRKKLINEVQR